MVFQIAPVVLSLTGLIEVGDLWRAVSDVVGVSVGPLNFVEAFTPSNIVPANDVSLVKGFPVLREKHVGKLILWIYAIIQEPLLHVVLVEPTQSLSGVVIIRGFAKGALTGHVGRGE